MKSGDWNWSVRYGKRGPAYSDFLSVMLTFDLPLSPNTRQQPLVSARQKELERIENEREDLLRRQTQDLETLLNELDEASSKLDRLTLQTAPLAAERSALTLAAYQSGRDKLAAVLEARKVQTETGLRALELQGKKLALQWRLNSLIAK
jgi:cobalt-zinc-cadmium efflux system outer membrane protein